MGSRGRKSKAELEIVPPSPVAPAVASVLHVPGHLRAAGAAFYRSMLAETDLGSADDLAVLTRACECLDRIAAAQVSIATHGEITVNQYNQPRLNPACTLEKQARDGFFSAMRMLNIEEEPKGSQGYYGSRDTMDDDDLNKRIEEICRERGLTFAPWEVAPWDCDEGSSPWPDGCAGSESWPEAQALRRLLIDEINKEKN